MISTDDSLNEVNALHNISESDTKSLNNITLMPHNELRFDFTSYSELIISLDTVVSNEPVNVVLEKVNKLLNARPKEEYSASHIKDAVKILIQWDGVARLAIKIATSISNKKSFKNEVYSELQNNFITEIGIPIPLDKNNDQRIQNIEEVLSKWLYRNAHAHRGDDDWFRKIVVCLISPRMTYEYFISLQEVCHELINNGSSKANAKKTSHRYEKYIKELLKVFTGEKISKGKAITLLNYSSIFEDELQKRSNDYQSLSEDNDKYRTLVKEFNFKLNELEEQLRITLREKDEIKLQLVQNEADIKILSEKYDKLEEHYKNEMKEKISGVANKMQKAIEHEIHTAESFLLSDPPNVSVALDRMKRVNAMIADFGGSHA